jgi:hypothetical protein
VKSDPSGLPTRDARIGAAGLRLARKREPRHRQLEAFRAAVGSKPHMGSEAKPFREESKSLHLDDRSRSSKSSTLTTR